MGSIENLTKCVQDFSCCFALQRLHLNQKEAPTAEAIRELWPCLFNNFYAEIHFQLLTGRNTSAFKQQFDSYVPRILIHGHITLDVENKEFITWTVVKMIFNYFKEDYKNLFTVEEVCVRFINEFHYKYCSYNLKCNISF